MKALSCKLALIALLVVSGYGGNRLAVNAHLDPEGTQKSFAPRLEWLNGVLTNVGIGALSENPQDWVAYGSNTTSGAGVVALLWILFGSICKCAQKKERNAIADQVVKQVKESLKPLVRT